LHVRHFLVRCADPVCDWQTHDSVRERDDVDAEDDHWKVVAIEHRDHTPDHWGAPVSVLVVDLDRPGVTARHTVA
jgi:hypothetical protein